MPVETGLLKSIPYFAGLSPSELDSISQHVLERKAERGEMIIYEGDPAETLFFVVSGAVKIFKTSTEGKEQILNIARPGESFNDAPTIDGGANLASAQAMGPVVLYELRKNEFRTLLQTYPQIAANTARVLAGQVRQLVSLVEDLSFKHVISRVAKVLLKHAGDGASPGMKLTQQEMAALAGTAREVVGRSLKSLEEDGLIRLDRHKIVITNKKALNELVETAV